MKRLLIIIALISALSSAVVADNTLRRNLKPATREEAAAPPRLLDTIACQGGELTVAGYDKPLTARREAFLVTNHCCDTVKGIAVEISYLDMKGRLLHRADWSTACEIPPGETRKIEKPTWDTQSSYYYHLGKRPRTSGVTPYSVRITPVNITIPHPQCLK